MITLPFLIVSLDKLKNLKSEEIDLPWTIENKEFNSSTI